MHAILYMSRASGRLSSADVSSLAEKWAGKNRTVGITGLLLFDGKRFMQLIEGAASDVEALMSVILCDHRHSEISMMIDEAVQGRQFPEWHFKLGLVGQAATPSDLRNQAAGYIGEATDPRVKAALMGFTSKRLSRHG